MKGTLYWVTGLSGSGKTTVSKVFYKAMKKNNIVFYQQSVGLHVLVNIKTLKLKWPSLENYYVLACKKIHDKNDINKKLLELID